MIAEIGRAKKDGDTLGGKSRCSQGCRSGGVISSGEKPARQPVAGAVMGIRRSRESRSGDGFETAARRGSVAHDEMIPDLRRDALDEPAGGLGRRHENGPAVSGARRDEDDPPVAEALAKVEHGHGDEAVAIHSAPDGGRCRSGRVVETMVALRAARRRDGEVRRDSLAETTAKSTATCGRWPTQASSASRYRVG